MDDRDLARLLALGRVLIGAVMLVAPRWATRVWSGERNAPASARVLARGLGGRDVAVGLGVLMTLDDDASVSRWLEAAALADACDALGILSVFGDLNGFKRLFWTVTAGGSAYLNIKLADELG